MIEIEHEIQIEGEISDEEINKSLKILGELIINKIKENIRQMDLIANSKGGGAFLQGWISHVSNGKLYIENTQEYSLYLEYGTYAYFAIHGTETYTEPPDPKKFTLTKQQALTFPKGMQAFASCRKVIYNESIMQKLVEEAFN